MEGPQEDEQLQDISDSDWDEAKIARIDAAVEEFLKEQEQEASKRSSLSADIRGGEDAGSGGPSLSASHTGEQERGGEADQEKKKARPIATKDKEKRKTIICV